MFYKFLKKPFFGSYMVKWRNPLSENEKKDWKKIPFKSKSGGTIKALYSKTNTETAKATIVLGHPMGKEAKGYFLKNGYTELLKNNGYNVFIFDINGFGESTHGNFSFFEDILAAGNEAKSLNPDLPLGYFGISLGGQMATITFADKNHPFQFAIIESAGTTLNEFWVIFPQAMKVLKILNLLLPTYTEKIKMIIRIKEVKNLNSILFIYSEIDTWTPLEMGKRFVENCNVSAELFILKTANHAAITKSKEKDIYFDKIISYFNSQVVKL